MLNLRAIGWIGLAICAAVSMTGCGDKSDTGKKISVKPVEMLSVDGIGPINAQTPFNLHDITAAFQGFNVSQHTNYTEGQQYPVIEVAKDLKTLLVINPDVKQEKIFSVMVQDNLIGNRLGHSIGMAFADIYAYGQTEECAAGAEELSGKVLCYAPKTGNILYQFGGSWSGPNGTVPPKDVLAGWKMESMIWKPLSPRAP
jgi:hypothetical protein